MIHSYFYITWNGVREFNSYRTDRLQFEEENRFTKVTYIRILHYRIHNSNWKCIPRSEYLARPDVKAYKIETYLYPIFIQVCSRLSVYRWSLSPMHLVENLWTLPKTFVRSASLSHQVTKLNFPPTCSLTKCG